LWYKRRNDDNFKINLSQIILNPSGSCYFSGKPKKNQKSLTNHANEINLEDELCELLHENSQLKNYLKEVNDFCYFMPFTELNYLELVLILNCLIERRNNQALTR